MKVNPQKLEAALQRIGDLSEHRGCPICGCTTWNLTSDILLRLASETPMIYRAAPQVSIPLLAVECDECGYQMLFNAIALGLVPKENR